MRGSGARLVTTAIVAASQFPFPQSLQKSGNYDREVHRLSRFRDHQTACSCLLTDGHSSYPGLSDYRHDPRTVGKMAGHVALPWIHRAFSLMKRWGLGTYHGLRPKHLDTYLNEFAFRYNRRFYRHVSFETVLGLASHKEPTNYWTIIGRKNPRAPAPAPSARRRSTRQTTKSRAS
jgi:transposase-like protein